MILLLRAELRRFAARRLMRLLALLTFVLLVIVLGRVAMVSHRPDAAELARRNEQLQQESVRSCEEAKARGDAPADLDCAMFADGGVYVADPRLHGRSALPGAVDAIAVTVALLAFVAGASFVGAEWHTGTMQALLLWEPRRGRVLLAKGAALVLGTVAFLLVLQAVTYAGIYLIAATRGTTEGVTSGLHTANLLAALRGAAMVSFVALFAFALAGLARVTAAALGVAFVYFAIVENLVRGLRPGWQRFLASENFAAIVNKETKVAPASARRLADVFFEEPQLYTLTAGRAVLTVGIYLALLVGAFYLFFTRRDVT